jgi:hypothetical protein
VVDSRGHARAGYDLTGDALVLVSPDGYLGLVASPGSIERVIEYWTTLHGAPSRETATTTG